MSDFLRPPADADPRRPVIFLAGPIQFQQSTSWHDRAWQLLSQHDGDFQVASPRRFDRPVDDFPEEVYNHQVDWETRHLRLAGTNGAVLFWLAREVVHRCERPHAQTTRFELGEWKEVQRRTGIAMVVGIESGFTGARYIRRRFAQDCPAVPVVDTLEEACAAVARILLRTTRAPVLLNGR